eukprot:scaffold3273_cov153-Skeletonema_dohrnii-CCMP3373.AAC.3
MDGEEATTINTSSDLPPWGSGRISIISPLRIDAFSWLETLQSRYPSSIEISRLVFRRIFRKSVRT